MFENQSKIIFLLFERIETEAIRLFVLGNERVKKGLIKAPRLQNCNSFLLSELYGLTGVNPRSCRLL